MLAIVRPGTCQLKSDNPYMRKRYLENFEMFFTKLLLLQKLQQIEQDLVDQQLQPHHEAELERLNDLRIQGMLQAERQCWKLHTRPYGWTPELTRLMAEIKYWCTSLRQVEGRPVNARLMYHLAKALSLPLHPTTTAEIIQHQLRTKKAQLKQKLGDPNCREKWLEGLAMAQAAETGGDATKCLHHLLRTEEQ